MSSKTVEFSRKVLKNSSWSYLIFPSQSLFVFNATPAFVAIFTVIKMYGWIISGFYYLFLLKKNSNTVFGLTQGTQNISERTQSFMEEYKHFERSKIFEKSTHFISPPPCLFRDSVDCAFSYHKNVVPSASLIISPHLNSFCAEKKSADSIWT